MTDAEKGYVDYLEVLGLGADAKPGEVRKAYRKKMKDLVFEIQGVEITEERRAHFLLEMAKLNAANYILRDNELRETYWRERQQAIELEAEWRAAAEAGSPDTDALRRRFDATIRHFLSHYVEEAMLDAGRDKECVEASGWDAAHERHASRILRHYRHGLYQDILERLPYHEVTPPSIDWDERRRTVAALVAGDAQ
jgi:curved DNA-binding protein CbpA